MDDETDHLKAFEKASSENLSYDFRDFYGLAELRAYQRGEITKPLRPKRGKRRKGGRAILTPELRAAILHETGSLNEVADRLGVSVTTVFRVRRANRQG